MCGRTACTLDPEDICRACACQVNNNHWVIPEWRDAPNGKQYYPSYNVSPTSHTPVMISKKHIDQECETTLKVIQPMYWGLVPYWHKGELKEVGLSTNNARSETLLEKRTFSVPMKKGRRCVVLADGYYEWQKSGTASKQPYFIYFPQQEGIKVENQSWKDKTDQIWSEKIGWGGPRLLTMAGIFDIWVDPSDSSEVYSYAVVTLDASPTVSWIHERMPAILDGEDAINNWLDFGKVPTAEAVQLIVPIKNLTCHPVSSIVGNSRNKSPECIQPIELKPEKKSKSSVLMMNWLKNGSPTKLGTALPIKELQNGDQTQCIDVGSTKRKATSLTSPKKIKKETN